MHLDQTKGQIGSRALALNPGWRFATVDEVGDLYDAIFSSLPIDSQGLYEVRGDGYTSRRAQFNAFYGVVGKTEDTSFTESAIGRIGSGISDLAFATLIHGSSIARIGIPLTRATPFTSNITQHGTYLVQDVIPAPDLTSVPISSTALLFGLGLIGLAGIKRKRDK